MKELCPNCNTFGVGYVAVKESAHFVHKCTNCGFLKTPILVSMERFVDSLSSWADRVVSA